MGKIKQLPEDVIARIAAGEVIERPSYAVKELLDNAIDAGADTITIHIEESGLKRIVVHDNGEGMSAEDLLLCLLPHTTSKLSDNDELLGIKTLGFRGEALASIAAIAQLSIKSRPADAAGGNEITTTNGVIEPIRPVGMPVGTIVTVDNLFYAIPVRKKFLKSAKTEFRQITDVVVSYALSYPFIHFVLTHNKKTIVDLPKCTDVLQRVQTLLGEAIFQNVLPVSVVDEFIGVNGFIGKPQVATKQNQKQYLFINNRYVSDKAISLAVKEAYATLIPATSTPIFILHLSIPPEAVDVNVHPRKEQVSFIDSTRITDAIKQGVAQALTSHNLVYNFAKLKQDLSTKIGETQSFAGEMLRDAVLPWNAGELGTIIREAPITSIHNTYLLTVTADGMMLVDQHAAHERVLYEQFVSVFEDARSKQEQYVLPKPLSLQVSVSDAQMIEEYMSYFTQLGFQIEPFQGTTFVIRAAPAVFKERNMQKIIADMLVDIANETGKTIDTKTQRMLAFLACRAAVKAGDALTKEQGKKLLEQLEATVNNTTCPHGRPTKIVITLTELHKLFKRK